MKKVGATAGAGWLGTLPADELVRFVANLKRASRVTTSREAPEDAGASLAIAQRSSELIAQLLDAAVERARGAPAQLRRDPRFRG
jgi:hypothetical protein